MKLYFKPVLLTGGSVNPDDPPYDPWGENSMTGGDDGGRRRSAPSEAKSVQALDQVVSTLSVDEPAVEIIPEVNDIVPDVEVPTVDISVIDIPME